jgi:hypothetical protein
MKQTFSEKDIHFKDLTAPETELARAFEDGIPRDIVGLSSLFEGRHWESLINRLAGYRCVVDALNQTRSAIKSFLAIPETEKTQITAIALWSYAMTQYCKCYSHNEGWTVTLEPTGTLKNESETVKAGHKWFMNERNTFLAHGGKTPSQKSYAFIGRRKESPHQVDGLLSNTRVAAAPSDATMTELDHLAEVSINYARTKNLEISKEILQKLLDEKYILNPELIEGFNLKKRADFEIKTAPDPV